MPLSSNTVDLEQLEILSKSTSDMVQKTLSAHQYTLSNRFSNDNHKVSQLEYPQKAKLREIVWYERHKHIQRMLCFDLQDLYT